MISYSTGAAGAMLMAESTPNGKRMETLTLFATFGPRDWAGGARGNCCCYARVGEISTSSTRNALASKRPNSCSQFSSNFGLRDIATRKLKLAQDCAPWLYLFLHVRFVGLPAKHPQLYSPHTRSLVASFSNAPQKRSENVWSSTCTKTL